jgi:hypothetical protein
MLHAPLTEASPPSLLCKSLRQMEHRQPGTASWHEQPAHHTGKHTNCWLLRLSSAPDATGKKSLPLSFTTTLPLSFHPPPPRTCSCHSPPPHSPPLLLAIQPLLLSFYPPPLAAVKPCPFCCQFTPPPPFFAAVNQTPAPPHTH